MSLTFMAVVTICSGFGTRMLEDGMNISVLEKGKKNSYCRYLKVKVKVAQSCPTLCDPMDYTVHGILQARILEWVALSRGSSQPRD